MKKRKRMARCCTAVVAKALRSGWEGNGDSHWSLQRKKIMWTRPIEGQLDISSTFMRNKELKVALTCCGGERGWPRAAGVNRRQGRHGGTGKATGG